MPASADRGAAAAPRRDGRPEMRGKLHRRVPGAEAMFGDAEAGEDLQGAGLERQRRDSWAVGAAVDQPGTPCAASRGG
jgi:hypothetical protein